MSIYVCYTSYNKPERIDSIRKIQQKIPNLLVLKDKREPSLNSARLNYADALDIIKDTGGILMEDDIWVPENFMEIADREIEKRRNEVIQFFDRRNINRVVYDEGHYSRFYTNQCTYFPPGLDGLPDYIRSGENEYYSESTGRWLRKHKIKTWYIYPNIVKHRPFDSTFQPLFINSIIKSELIRNQEPIED